jgi:hypothetical protein
MILPEMSETNNLFRLAELHFRHLPKLATVVVVVVDDESHGSRPKKCCQKKIYCNLWTLMHSQIQKNSRLNNRPPRHPLKTTRRLRQVMNHPISQFHRAFRHLPKLATVVEVVAAGEGSQRL